MEFENAEKIKFFPDVHTDPRSEDFREDSELWVRLFGMVQEISKLGQGGITPGSAARLYGHFKYLRIMGTRLQRSQQWGFILEPVIREDCWASREQYDKGKRVLDPYRQQVVELLKGLAEGENEFSA